MIASMLELLFLYLHCRYLAYKAQVFLWRTYVG
jgi:hypothetical protein